MSIGKTRMVIPPLDLDTDLGLKELDMRSYQVTDRVSFLRSRDEELASEPENEAGRSWMEQSTQLSVQAKGNWAKK